MEELVKRLDKYIKLTDKALKEVKKTDYKKAKNLVEMSENYYKDALHFKEKGDFINAFAAINYAHAFLDAAALLRLVTVKDNTLFMVE